MFFQCRCICSGCFLTLQWPPLVPFDVVEEVLGDLVYVEELVSGEREVEATPQRHLPQFLGSLVYVQTAVAQEEADYKKQNKTKAFFHYPPTS